MESGCSSSNGEVDNGVWVRHGFDGISVSIRGQVKSTIFGVKAVLILAEVYVVELIGRPKVGLVFAFWIEDLAVELACCPYSALHPVSIISCAKLPHNVRNIAIDDLGETEMSTIRH